MNFKKIILKHAVATVSVATLGLALTVGAVFATNYNSTKQDANEKKEKETAVAIEETVAVIEAMPEPEAVVEAETPQAITLTQTTQEKVDPVLCDLSGCNITTTHSHDGVDYLGHQPGDGHNHSICPTLNCTISKEHTHGNKVYNKHHDQDGHQHGNEQNHNNHDKKENHQKRSHGNNHN